MHAPVTVHPRPEIRAGRGLSVGGVGGGGVGGGGSGGGV